MNECRVVHLVRLSDCEVLHSSLSFGAVKHPTSFAMVRTDGLAASGEDFLYLFTPILAGFTERELGSSDFGEL